MKQTEPKIDFAIGGQAVMEGVMMRSPNYYTVTVRDEHGNLQTMQREFKSVLERMKGLNLPLLRGVVHLVESMTIGIRSLNYSNDIFIGKEEDENTGPVKKVLYGVFSAIYLVGTLGFTLFMLKFLPLWVAQQAANVWPVVDHHYILFNAVDGVTKITIFIGYILVISLVKDIRRVFQYHGAEHKSIWTYEKGLELNVKNAMAQTRFHPRCGTSFIFIVILMSVLVYTVFPSPDSFWLKLAIRVAVMPLIAGVSYELLKVSAKWQRNPLMRLFILPGLLIQRLTTLEPDESQMEVALHSLTESLKVEKLPVL